MNTFDEFSISNQKYSISLKHNLEFEEIIELVEKIKNFFSKIDSSSNVILNATVGKVDENFKLNQSIDTERRTLKEVVDEYIKANILLGKWTDKTTVDVKAIFKVLCKIIGDETDIASITPATIEHLVSKLKKFPTNPFKKNKKIIEKSVEEICATSDRTLSISSINKYITRIGALLRWCEKRQYIQANPCTGIKLKDPVNARDKRSLFTKDDLIQLFTSPIYNPKKFVKKHEKYLKKGKHYFWLPLIGLFSGLRLEEICSLNTADIQISKGIHFFDINPNSPDKHLKNKSSKRIVPVHPVIISLGFLEYVKSVKGKKLFPGLKRSRFNYSHNYSNSFSRHCKKYINSNSKLSFHSFRHNFINVLYRVNIKEFIIKDLVGHSRGRSVTRSVYLKDANVIELYDAIKKIDYKIDFIEIFKKQGVLSEQI